MTPEGRRGLVLAVACSNVVVGLGFVVLSDFGSSSLVLLVLGVVVGVGGLLAIGLWLREGGRAG